MNRRKKSIQIVKARIKKANAKLSTKNKPKYISKAEREKLALVDIETSQTGQDLATNVEQELSAELGLSADESN